MPIHDFKSQRLFCNDSMEESGKRIWCTPLQINYLFNVLRLKNGNIILIFNGRDGEWYARLNQQDKRTCSLELISQNRPQTNGPDIQFLFAPLKRERLDYMVQKVTELGVAKIQPIYTKHTVANSINLKRIYDNVIKASQQCGILRIPEIRKPEKLLECLNSWDAERILIFSDENADVSSPIRVLEEVRRGKIAVLVGPEGGFSDYERNFLLDQLYVRRISLGPRIMRADTAAVAALALVNAVIGDWQNIS
ncbi:MAG: Ribosomal RNA small subunit methyltransferase E [Hyphomicrobiaceae bacterium hypho_1]